MVGQLPLLFKLTTQNQFFWKQINFSAIPENGYKGKPETILYHAANRYPNHNDNNNIQQDYQTVKFKNLLIGSAFNMYEKTWFKKKLN